MQINIRNPICKKSLKSKQEEIVSEISLLKKSCRNQSENQSTLEIIAKLEKSMFKIEISYETHVVSFNTTLFILQCSVFLKSAWFEHQ